MLAKLVSINFQIRLQNYLQPSSECVRRSEKISFHMQNARNFCSTTKDRKNHFFRHTVLPDRFGLSWEKHYRDVPIVLARFKKCGSFSDNWFVPRRDAKSMFDQKVGPDSKQCEPCSSNTVSSLPNSPKSPHPSQSTAF